MMSAVCLPTHCVVADRAAAFFDAHFRRGFVRSAGDLHAEQRVTNASRQRSTLEGAGAQNGEFLISGAMRHRHF